MLVKSLLTILLTACGVATGASSPNSPTEYQPPPGPPQEDKDHYFCCHDVDPKTYSGNGCTEIPESRVVLCDDVLYCDKGYTKEDNGKITCK